MGTSSLLKEIFRISFIVSGLTGFGLIVCEILKKWGFIAKGPSYVWIILSVLALFACKTFFNSSYIQNHPDLSSAFTKRIVMIINGIFVIIAIIVLISIPFIWFGTIEELAR